MNRTTQQNRSLHKYCELLARALDAAGIDMKQAIRVPIRPTKENVKETMVHAVMGALYPDVKSTADLTTKQMMEVYENMNRITGELFGMHVAWPSVESLSEAKRDNQ